MRNAEQRTETTKRRMQKTENSPDRTRQDKQKKRKEKGRVEKGDKK